MDRSAIEAKIPQRAPFLFVDEVVDQEEKRIITKFNVTGDEDFFKGHFPGNPIMPGVLLQEALFQTGALLMSSSEGSGLGVVTKVSNARFKSMVRPGDVLEMEVVLDDQLANAFMFKGKTRVNGKVVAGVDFTCARVEG